MEADISVQVPPPPYHFLRTAPAALFFSSKEVRFTQHKRTQQPAASRSLPGALAIENRVHVSFYYKSMCSHSLKSFLTLSKLGFRNL